MQIHRLVLNIIVNHAGTTQCETALLVVCSILTYIICVWEERYTVEPGERDLWERDLCPFSEVVLISEVTIKLSSIPSIDRSNSYLSLIS